MQVQLSEVATAISEATLKNLYGDEIISLARASDLYVRCKDSSGCGNLNLDLENCQMWLSHVTENTYGDLFSIEYMIEKGSEVLDSGTSSIYSSDYDQSDYCDATKYEYIRLLLVEGYPQYMMAKQAEYENEVEA